MGLFSANFSKEGPGVDKNAPQKKRFFLFFDIYFRKFWKILQINLLYIPFLIPASVGAYFWIFGGFNIMSLLLILISAILLGPATAGMTYVLRNFAREEHAFVFSDFRDAFKSNFKQAAIYSTGSIAVFSLLVTAALFYWRSSHANAFMYIPLALSLAGFLIFSFMNFYMYTMIVTFRLTLRQMLKNAFIFSVLGVFANLFTFVVVGVIIAAMVLFFPITVLFLATIAFSTSWFIITFNAYPRIKKFMIDPHTDQGEDGGDTEEQIFSDERLIPENPNEDR